MKNELSAELEMTSTEKLQKIYDQLKEIENSDLK
jgi:hypothetical protein